MIPEFFEYSLPTKVVYGEGLVNDFSAELAGIPAKKFFVITDKVIRKIGLADKVIEGLKNSGAEFAGIYDDVPENSEVKVCIAAAEAAKASGAEGILAVGGGSVIDTAKAANILFTLGGDLVEDYSGAETITENLKPLIVIPTTAGTGSEVTGAAVIYNEEEQVKSPFTDRHLLPVLAILDPEMTYTMPAKITAATGMDALTHAVEAYVGVNSSPFSDALALGAIKMIRQHLINACQNPEDAEARGGMLIASCLAGTAFNHSMVGIVHGMAHTIGGLHHAPHGMANSICLPYGMMYNLEECVDAFASLAHYFGEDTKGKEPLEAANLAVEAVFKLRKQLKEVAGLPDRLSEIGIKEEDLEAIAEGTVMDGTSFYNPREVEAEIVLEYLKKAL